MCLCCLLGKKNILFLYFFKLSSSSTYSLYPRYFCRRVLSICPFVCLFLRTSFRHLSEICVKVSQVVNISATTNQKAFIFGPQLSCRVGIRSMIPDPKSIPRGAIGRNLGHRRSVFSLSFVMESSYVET